MVDDLDQYFYRNRLKMIVEFKQGDSFGELAILNKSKRSATIVCKSECSFAILGRDDFNKILRVLTNQYYRMIRKRDRCCKRRNCRVFLCSRT